MFCSCSNGWTLSLRIQPPWPLRPSRTYPGSLSSLLSLLPIWTLLIYYLESALTLLKPFIAHPTLKMFPPRSDSNLICHSRTSSWPLLSRNSLGPALSSPSHLSSLCPHSVHSSHTGLLAGPLIPQALFPRSLHLAGCTTGFLFFRF